MTETPNTDGYAEVTPQAFMLADGNMLARFIGKHPGSATQLFHAIALRRQACVLCRQKLHWHTRHQYHALLTVVVPRGDGSEMHITSCATCVMRYEGDTANMMIEKLMSDHFPDGGARWADEAKAERETPQAPLVIPPRSESKPRPKI